MRDKKDNPVVGVCALWSLLLFLKVKFVTDPLVAHYASHKSRPSEEDR